MLQLEHRVREQHSVQTTLRFLTTAVNSKKLILKISAWVVKSVRMPLVVGNQSRFKSPILNKTDNSEFDRASGICSDKSILTTERIA